MSQSKPLPSLRPLKPDQFLPSVGRWTTLGGLILIASIGAAVTLAAVLKYNTSVRATATVRPVGELRLVQAGVEGKVTKIKVQANQPVRQGDVIAQLDATQLTSQKQQLQTTLQQEQTQLNQLNGQIQLLNAKIAAETASTQQLAAIAATELARDQRSYRDQQLITRSELAEAEAALALADSEFQRYQQLAAGAVSQLQIEEKQTAVRVLTARCPCSSRPRPQCCTADHCPTASRAGAVYRPVYADHIATGANRLATTTVCPTRPASPNPAEPQSTASQSR